MLHSLPESDCEWKDVDEGIDLEHAEEEHSEVFECFGEEVPEEAKIRSLVWDTQAAG